MILSNARRLNKLAVGFIIFSIAGLAGLMTSASAQDQAVQEPEIDKGKIKIEIRERLDGSIWSLILNESGGGKKNIKDTLTFDGRTVSSERLLKEGYNTSNYSLMVQDDGSAVWQTMQVKEGAGRSFWRGEFKGEDKMYGMLSKQPTEGTPQNFSFNAILEKGVKKPEPSVVEEPVVVPPPVQEEQAVEETVEPVAEEVEEAVD